MHATLPLLFVETSTFVEQFRDDVTFCGMHGAREGKRSGVCFLFDLMLENKEFLILNALAVSLPIRIEVLLLGKLLHL